MAIFVGLAVVAAIGVIAYLLGDYIQEKDKKLKIEKEKKARLAAETAHKEEIKRRERELVERFTNSELTKNVIGVLCKGNPEIYLPEKIWIYDHVIQGELNGDIRTFDFAKNRIHSFAPVICSGEAGEEFNRRFAEMEKPQLAMATALNNLLRGQYAIFDFAKEDFEREPYIIGGGFYTRKSYRSDYVLMQLRSTLPNQSF